MPPPESSGRSSQSSGDGSKRWFTTSARSGPSPARRSRSARTTVFQRSVCAIRHGNRRRPGRARTIATASAPVVASGFSIRSALPRGRHGLGDRRGGGSAARRRRRPATAGSATRSRQSAWKRTAELARLRRAALGVAPAEAPRARSSGHVGADVVQVALAVLAGADEADGSGDIRRLATRKDAMAPARLNLPADGCNGNRRTVLQARHGIHHHPALPRLRRHRLRRRLPRRLHLRVHAAPTREVPEPALHPSRTSASTAARASPSAPGRRSSRRSPSPTSSRTTPRSTTP